MVYALPQFGYSQKKRFGLAQGRSPSEEEEASPGGGFEEEEVEGKGEGAGPGDGGTYVVESKL